MTAEGYDDYPIPGERKRKRTRLAKSELWMLAAMWAGDHAADVGGRARRPGERPCRPFEEWGDDDLLVDLARRYDLIPADLERLLTQIADECETKAIRSGFEDAWR